MSKNIFDVKKCQNNICDVEKCQFFKCCPQIGGRDCSESESGGPVGDHAGRLQKPPGHPGLRGRRRRGSDAQL
jgi:hypothetical protein